MTDVVEAAVINGEGEEVDNDITEKEGSPQPEDLEENQLVVSGEMDAEPDGDVMDTDSSAFPDSSQQPENAAAEQEEEEEEDLQLNSNTETQDTTDGETGTAEENTMEIAEVVSAANIKMDPDAESISQLDEPEDEEEEQISGEESEPVLITKTSGATANATTITSITTVRNGEANSIDENSTEKSLLTGLLKNSTDSPAKSPQQGRSFSVSDGNAIAKELEEQVSKLNQLLVLKEKEWSAILRLKKHVEYALDQVRCTQRIAKVQDGLNGPLSPTDIKACMNLIVSEKEAFNHAERQIEESIESAEIENESLQTIFPFRSQSQRDGTTKSESFTATAALQKLCERKRKAMDDLAPGRASRLRIVDVQSNAPQLQSKVIGNGRKGAIVDVQSIIQSHRSLTGDKSSDKQKGTKKNITFTSTLQMTPDRQYIKTLEDLMAMVEAEKQQKEPVAAPAPPPPVVVAQVNRSITPKPKNGKAPRPSGNNSLLANPSPSSSGTLAKMLSPSTHSSIGTNRSSNDVSTNSQKFSSKLPNADANLSLANLLATSKVDTKINISKIKKERNVRDDDASHAPAHQEAVPICQGCNLSRAQFVCAGCANQWYCSRECQVNLSSPILEKKSLIYR